MKQKLLIILLSSFSIAFSQGPMTPLSTSETYNNPDWTLTTITGDNAFDFPWEVTYGPDNMLWLTERIGEKVVRISTTGGTPETLIDFSDTGLGRVTTAKQGGLMGMAIHPALYTNLSTITNNYVFVSYTYDDGNGLQLKIVRLVYSHGNGTLTEDSNTLFPNGAILIGLPASEDHNSGRLIIGPDEKLYYTIGDQGANQFNLACNPNLAQDLPAFVGDFDNYPGKTLRINIDGSIPQDNPVLDGVQTHINTYGHRNAQGIIFAADETLYVSEHGPKTDDEINILKSGKNYGWPLIAGYYDDANYEYCNWSSSVNCVPGENSNTDHSCIDGSTTLTETQSYSSIASNFEPPIGTYGSTTSAELNDGWGAWPTPAVSSIDIHETGNIPGWGRSLLIPSLKKGTIYRAKLTPDGADIVGDDNLDTLDGYEEFLSSIDRYRDLAISPDGLTIYAITDNSGGTSGPSSENVVSSLENKGRIIKIQYVGPLVTNPPVASCQDITVTLDPTGNATITVSDINNGSTGGSAGIDTIVINKDTFDCTHVGIPQTVWLTVTDNDGNESRCTSIVTVQANSSPNPIIAPTLDAIVSNCAVTVTAPVVTSNGCVDITGTTMNQTTFTEGQSGSITWSFNNNGTIVNALQSVTVNALNVPVNIVPVPGSSTASISWNVVEGVTYNVRYRKTGTVTWINAGTSLNAITLSGLELLTNYELQVNSDCGSAQSAYSAIVPFTTTGIIYCDSQGVTGGYISNVTIYGEDYSINNGTSGDTGYTDYTSVTPVDLNANGTTLYTLTISTNYNQSGIAVWIDLNQDGDFEDTDEKVWNEAGGDNANSPRSKSFTLPTSALVGHTRMRIASRQYWVPGSSCGVIVESGQSSEVEDYTVNIINSTLSTTNNNIVNVNVFPNPIKNELIIRMPSNYNYDVLNIVLYDIQGRVVKTKTVTSSNKNINIKLDDLDKLSKGVYFLRLQDANKTISSKKLLKM